MNDHGVTAIAFRRPRDYDRQAPEVARHLRAGGLIAYPTETVYGLGSALRPKAIARLAELKGRAERKPFLLLIEDPEQVPGLIWTAAARALAERFWPGALTLALRAESSGLPAGVIGPDGTVAVRASPHPAVRAILHALGEPITSSSANRPGREPARTAMQAAEVLRELGSPADVWLLDGGGLPPSAPSTIVDCAGPVPRLLRAGAISKDELETAVEEIDGHG